MTKAQFKKCFSEAREDVNAQASRYLYEIGLNFLVRYAGVDRHDRLYQKQAGLVPANGCFTYETRIR